MKEWNIPPQWQRVLALLAGAALAVYILESTAGTLLPFLRRSLEVLTPLIIAFAVAYLLDPVVDAFEKRGLPRHGGIGLVVAIGVLILGAVVVVVVPAVADQIGNLGPKVMAYSERSTDWLKTTLGERYPQGAERIKEMGRVALQEMDWQAMAQPLKAWATSLASGGRAAVATLLNLLLIPILTVYLLADIDIIKDRLAQLIPPARRDAVTAPLREVDLALSGFVRGQLTVAAALASMYMAGLFLSGTPLGLTIGLFAGIAAIIPYLGLLLGLLPALVLTLLEHGPSWNVLGVAVTFLIAQLLEGWVITPRIMGNSVGLHPVLVIFAVVAGGSFFGVPGMLLAVPAVAAAMVFIRRGHARYVQSATYNAGAPPAAAPAAAPDPTDDGHNKD